MSEKVLKEVAQEELSEIVELIDDTGRTLKFYHIYTMEYKKEWYAFFQPAEEMPEVEEDSVIIFRISGDEGNEVLLPVEDEELLDEIFDEFCNTMEEEDAAAEAMELEPEEFYCDGNCSNCDEECDEREID